MKRIQLQSSMARRSFLTRLGAGVSVVGASPMVQPPRAAAQSAVDAHWQAARHVEDDWFDKIPGVHRLVFDTTTPDGLGIALQFGGNYFTANQSGYGLQDSDLAVVVVVRHKSTSFGYNDSIWAKYGTYFSTNANFTDPKTKEAPIVNVYGTSGGTSGQPGRLDLLLKRGVHLAVCQMATRNLAGVIARATGGNADNIFNELGANLLSNSRLVPAGIVAVSRAQERGYTLVTAI